MNNNHEPHEHPELKSVPLADALVCMSLAFSQFGITPETFVIFMSTLFSKTSEDAEKICLATRVFLKEILNVPYDEGRAEVISIAMLKVSNKEQLDTLIKQLDEHMRKGAV